MENSSPNLVRAPIAPPEPQKAETPQDTRGNSAQNEESTGGSAPTPGELIGLNREPYLIELMSAGPAYKTFDIAEQSQVVDEFIRDEAKDTRKDYSEKFEKLLEKIKQTGDIYKDMEQLYTYVKIQNKIKEVIREKEEFDRRDPSEMTATQLKRFFKEHADK